jgi:hypothetical protein
MLGCFVAGMAIMALGGTVAIENIRKGDMVLSRNDILGITEYKPVTDIFVHDGITKLTHIQYNNGDEIIATPNHPFYILNKGYIEAGSLRAGDILLLVNGKTVAVEAIQHEILEQPITVYNIEVADNHNYYVAQNLTATSETLVLVHNAKCDFKAIDAKNFEKANGLSKDTFHLKVKPEIKRLAPPKEFLVGRNPDIMVNRAGQIAYQGAKGKGFQETTLFVADILASLFGGK